MVSALINDSVKVLKKFKDDGSKIIGIVQHGIFPDELVTAAAAIPLHLILGGKDEQELGDQYLSATTCPFGRSTLGFIEKKHPLYSLIDTMIVGTYCNGVQNVSNYLGYFQIPSIPLILPHTRSDLALNFYLNELKKIKSYLEHLTGNKITPKSLSDVINVYNEMRALLRKVNNFRKQNITPVRGTTIQQLVAEAYLIGPQLMIPKINNLLQQLNDKPLQYSGSRVFLTGSGITLGDSFLELIEDQCGGIVVADDLWSASDYFLEDVNSNSNDPLKALAERYLRKNLSGRMIPDLRSPEILRLYHSFRASGIINHTLKYCDSYSNLKPEFRKIMKGHNIPVLDLDRDYAEAVGQIQTRIEAFLEMIR